MTSYNPVGDYLDLDDHRNAQLARLVDRHIAYSRRQAFIEAAKIAAGWGDTYSVGKGIAGALLGK